MWSVVFLLLQHLLASKRGTSTNEMRGQQTRPLAKHDSWTLVPLSCQKHSNTRGSNKLSTSTQKWSIPWQHGSDANLWLHYSSAKENIGLFRKVALFYHPHTTTFHFSSISIGVVDKMASKLPNHSLNFVSFRWSNPMYCIPEEGLGFAMECCNLKSLS